MALKITPGNTADSTVLDEITQHLRGKLYADKDYISRALCSKLWQRGLHLITGIRRNMPNLLWLLSGFGVVISWEGVAAIGGIWSDDWRGDPAWARILSRWPYPS